MVPTKRDKGIPIPPPREGRDGYSNAGDWYAMGFQSTLPVGGRDDSAPP